MDIENNISIVEELTPAVGNIDMEDLLNNIEKHISEHVILPEGASTAIALWCLASFNINSFRIFPKLMITSPEKRCGKSTVLDLIEAFSNRSLMTSNMTSAAIFRLIDSWQPTLIIDEADMFIAGGTTGMTGIINSGHAKNRAFVTRCVGDNHDVKKFSTWTPMVLASIGDLQPTIMDRSVVITLKRKAKGETSKCIDVDLFDKVKSSREELLKWSNDHADDIKNNLVEPPYLGNDRTVDNWLPLFTLANQVSPEWRKKCEESYRLLNEHEDEPELATLLLADIRDILSNHDDDKISSADMVKKLLEDKDKPWGEFKNGRPITQSGLAKVLGNYKIKPKTIRYKGNTPRGYELKQFTDTFERYLPDQP